MRKAQGYAVAGFDSDSVKAVATVPGIRKMSQEEIDSLNALLNGASTIPPQHDTSQDVYAMVEKNGETIATLYKDGTMMTSNSVAQPSDLAWMDQGSSLPTGGWHRR